MSSTTIPYIIGITGHRDIAESSIPFVEKSLNDFFDDLKKSLPDTPIYLLTPLADGADRITTQIALQYGIEIVVPLPFEQEEYEKDFSDASKAEFRDYLKKSIRVYFVGYDTQNADGVLHDRSAQYEYMGHHIADHCNILIAIWDGVELDKRGGTSKVIEYKREGNEKGLYKNLYGEFLIQIPAQRSSNTSHALSSQENKMTYISLGENNSVQFIDIKRELDEINKLNQKFATHQPLQTIEGTFVEKMHRVADGIADQNRDDYHRSVISIMSFSWIALLAIQLVYATKWNGFLFLYVGMVILVFLYYRNWISKRRLQENFVLMRGISEALKFQHYWNQAGIHEKVSNHYLRYSNDLSWVRTVLSNSAYCSKYVLNESVIQDMDRLKHDWIDDQVSYYSNAIKSRKNKLDVAENRTVLAYNLGVFFTIIAGITFAVKYCGWNSIDMNIVHFGYSISMFLSGVMIATGAFISEKYIAFKGFKEEISSFEIMKNVYTIAAAKLDKTPEEKKWKIFYDLGKKALDENGRWVMMHNSKKLHKSGEKHTKASELLNFIKNLK